MAKVFEQTIDNKLDINLHSSDIITIIINDNININYHLINGNYKILVFNNSNVDLTLNESGIIDNSTVEINYLELNDKKFVQYNNIVVNQNSSLIINSTYLGTNDKKIDYKLINNEKDSYIKISNNVVCLNEADFILNVVGKIVKGAKRAKCFQKSRCLTFENPKSAKILPILEIDENDVEASHSLSSGTIDQDVMFYMNSRGLNPKDALALLLVSYLMPSDDFYSQFESGNLIKEIANKKVETICSI